MSQGAKKLAKVAVLVQLAMKNGFFSPITSASVYLSDDLEHFSE